VVVGSEAVVEVFTAAAPGLVAFTGVEPSMPVACARHILSQVARGAPDMDTPAGLAVQ
jgi:hypothetical protein